VLWKHGPHQLYNPVHLQLNQIFLEIYSVLSKHFVNVAI
jgi:hypothetical protein